MQPLELSSVPGIRYDGNYLSDVKVFELSSLSLLVFRLVLFNIICSSQVQMSSNTAPQKYRIVESSFPVSSFVKGYPG